MRRLILLCALFGLPFVFISSRAQERPEPAPDPGQTQQISPELVDAEALHCEIRLENRRHQTPDSLTSHPTPRMPAPSSTPGTSPTTRIISTMPLASTTAPSPPAPIHSKPISRSASSSLARANPTKPTPNCWPPQPWIPAKPSSPESSRVARPRSPRQSRPRR